MARYLLGRLGQAVFVLWAAYTVTFAILYALPGDPVAIMLDSRGDGRIAEAGQIEALRQEYGLDQPLAAQYLEQLGRVVRGDFGVSIESGQDVFATVLRALPETLKLAAAALAIAVAAGTVLAVLATYARRRWLREALLSLPPLGVSVPTFWIGLMLMQLFSFRWPIFPAMGNDSPGSLVLPALTLAIPTAAGFAQLLARSLQTALDQAYAQTAFAKGASRLRVHLRHALRNAAIPALTLIGMSAGGLLGGSVVTETVFSRAGVGRLTEIAVHAQDIPMVQGLVLLSTAVFVLVNLAVDLVYPLLDPRIAQDGLRRDPAGRTA